MNDHRTLHKLILNLQAGVATKLAAPILHADRPRIRRKQWWRYGLALVAAMALLWARAPERLLAPQFYAEDGWVFFADAFNLPTWQALTAPYNGYDHLFPRLLAELSQWLPLRVAPLAFSLSALIITAICLTWFLLPPYRVLIRHDALRLAVVLLLLTSPNLEGVMSIAYLQWFLAIWALLVTFVWPTQHRWWSGVLTLVYIGVIFSAPIVLIFVPFWLLRSWFAPTRLLRWSAGTIVVAHCLFLVRIWQQRSDPLAPLNPGELGLSLLDLGRAMLYKILAVNLLGNQVAEWLHQSAGWLGIYLVAGLIIAGLLWALAWSQTVRTPAQLLLTVSLLYVIFIAAPFYWLRTYGHEYPFLESTGPLLRDAARYFVLPSLALYLLMARMLDANWGGLRVSRWRFWFGGGLAALLVVYGLALRAPTLKGGDWPQDAHLIAQLQAGTPAYRLHPVEPLASPVPPNPQLFLPLIFADHGGGDNALGLDIPIAPSGWAMHLRIAPRPAQAYDLLGGPTLLWIEPRRVEQGMVVRLHWQGNTLANARHQRHYFAELHLVDQAGEPLIHSEQPLVAPSPVPTAPFITEHLLPLTAQEAASVAHVRIGLYQLAGDQRIPGPAVEVEGLFGL